MPELIIKPVEKPTRKEIGLNNLRDKPRVEKTYEAEKVNLSKNIRAFDNKPRVYTENPYSYNYVSLKKEYRITPSASQMVSNPLYNSVGKVLGLDTNKEWNQYYDKVFVVTEWAKKKVGDDIRKIIKFISEKSKTIPSMGARRIDDIYIHAGLTK